MKPEGTRREAGRRGSAAQAFSQSENLGEGESNSPELESNHGTPSAAQRSGRVWEIEDLAFRDEPMPKGLNAAEQLLFLQLRYLYRYARLIRMPRDRGRREKAKLLQEFQKRAAQVRHMEKSDAMWREIEAAGNRYGTEPTIENADAFYRAVYGVKRKEEPK